MVAAPARPRWRAELDEPVIAVQVMTDRVVAAGSEGALLVTDLAGQRQYHRRLGGFPLTVSASPDGSRLAVGTDSGMGLYDLSSGVPLCECPSGWCGEVAWAAHSGAVAFGAGRRVRLLDRDGHRYWTSPPMRSTVAGLAWTRRDGKRLAVAAYQGVTLYEPVTNRLIKHLDAPGAIAGLAVCANGRWVVGGSQDATLHGWRVPAGGEFQMSGFPATVARLAFDPTGRWLANDAGEMVTLWDFSGPGPTGRDALLAQGLSGPVNALTWASSLGASRFLLAGDQAGWLAQWQIGPHHRAGGRIRPAWLLRAGDPVTALAAAAELVVSGHRSGAVLCHARLDQRGHAG